MELFCFCSLRFEPSGSPQSLDTVEFRSQPFAADGIVFFE